MPFYLYPDGTVESEGYTPLITVTYDPRYDIVTARDKYGQIYRESPVHVATRRPQMVQQMGGYGLYGTSIPPVLRQPIPQVLGVDMYGNPYARDILSFPTGSGYMAALGGPIVIPSQRTPSPQLPRYVFSSMQPDPVPKQPEVIIIRASPPPAPISTASPPPIITRIEAPKITSSGKKISYMYDFAVKKHIIKIDGKEPYSFSADSYRCCDETQYRRLCITTSDGCERYYNYF